MADKQVGTSAAEELYGPGAITGNLDDLDNIDVEVSSGGTHVTIKGEDEEGETGAESDKDVKPDTDGSNDNTDDSSQADGKEATDGDGEKAPEVERQELKDAVNELGTNLKEKGIDFEAAIKELEDNGSLSEATYTKLSEAGYSKTVIDGYIKAAEIVERNFETAIHNLAGSEENYKQVMGWAFQNVPKNEQVAYDAALDRNDLATAKLYMDSFIARMGSSFGTGSPRLPGAPRTATTVEGYKTKAELSKATSDRRYGRDRAYTKEVEQKLMKTNWL